MRSLLRRPTCPVTVALGTRFKICRRSDSYRGSYPHAPQYSTWITAAFAIRKTTQSECMLYKNICKKCTLSKERSHKCFRPSSFTWNAPNNNHVIRQSQGNDFQYIPLYTYLEGMMQWTNHFTHMTRWPL